MSNNPKTPNPPKPTKPNQTHLKSDFVPIKGDKTRKYQNTKTGEVISRRAYDQKYGVARQFGSYETKSKTNASINPLEHFARPSRGKKSMLKEVEKFTQQEKSEFIHKEITRQQEKELSKKNQRIYDNKMKRQLKPPRKINTKIFKKGRYSMWRDYLTHIDYEDMLDIIIMGKQQGDLFGYQAGFEVLNEKENKTYIMTLLQLRDFSVPFTIEDYEEMIENLNERGYIIMLAGVIRLFGEYTPPKP